MKVSKVSEFGDVIAFDFDARTVTLRFTSELDARRFIGVALNADAKRAEPEPWGTDDHR